MASGDEQGQTFSRVKSDLGELAVGMTEPEERGLAAQEQVQVFHDHRKLPLAGEPGQFPNPIASVPHRLDRGPASQKQHRLSSRNWSRHRNVITCLRAAKV